MNRSLPRSFYPTFIARERLRSSSLASPITVSGIPAFLNALQKLDENVAPQYTDTRRSMNDLKNPSVVEIEREFWSSYIVLAVHLLDSHRLRIL